MMRVTQQLLVVQQQEAPLCVNDAGDAANVGGAATGAKFVVLNHNPVKAWP